MIRAIFLAAAMTAASGAHPQTPHHCEGMQVESSGSGAVYTKRAWSQAAGRCVWMRDVDTTNAVAEGDAHADRLWTALRTRHMTDDELSEALDMGDAINVRPNRPYDRERSARERDEAWKEQMRRQEVDRLRRCQIETPVMDGGR